MCFFNTHECIYMVLCLCVKLLGHQECIWKTNLDVRGGRCQCSLHQQCLCELTFLSAELENCKRSIFLSVFGVFFSLHFSHSSGYVLLLHCDFNFYIPDAVTYLFICVLAFWEILFCEMSVQGICPLFFLLTCLCLSCNCQKLFRYSECKTFVGHVF